MRRRKVIHVATWPLRSQAKNLYLRIGRNFGSSRCGLDAEWRAETGKCYEGGTSVYFLRPHRDSYMIAYPSERRACYGIGGDYFGHMFTDVLLAPICAGEIFIVRGRLIAVKDCSDEAWDYYAGSRGDGLIDLIYEREGEEAAEAAKHMDLDLCGWDYDTGSDGEPLLVSGSAKIVKQLTLPEFLGLYIGDSYRVGDMRSWSRSIQQLCDERECYCEDEDE